MSGNVEVAILLATYNGGKYLSTQLDSIINQTYENWKVFISDDGSTDNTLTVIKEYVDKYPEKIKLVDKEKPTGCAKKNFMFLASQVKGYKYVMFCDQDDYWLKDKISVTLRKMQDLEKSHKGRPCLVHTDLEVVDGELKTIKDSFFEFSSLDSNRSGINHLLIQNIVTGCTMMVNKELLEIAQADVNIDRVLMHDWWYALVATTFGGVGFVDRVTMKYRQHGNNSVGAKASKDLSYIVTQIQKGKANHKALEDTMIQAEEFYSVYGEQTSGMGLEIVKGYSELISKSKLNRIKYIWNNGIWKNGVTRKIAQIIYL